MVLLNDADSVTADFVVIPVTEIEVGGGPTETDGCIFTRDAWALCNSCCCCSRLVVLRSPPTADPVAAVGVAVTGFNTNCSRAELNAVETRWYKSSLTTVTVVVVTGTTVVVRNDSGVMVSLQPAASGDNLPVSSGWCSC